MNDGAGNWTKKSPSADLLGLFLHTGIWHLIYLNINVSTSIASVILSQMFPIRIFSLYILLMECYIVLDSVGGFLVKRRFQSSA